MWSPWWELLLVRLCSSDCSVFSFVNQSINLLLIANQSMLVSPLHNRSLGLDERRVDLLAYATSAPSTVRDSADSLCLGASVFG